MKTKIQTLYNASFFRAPVGDEVGPQLEKLNIAADTEMEALRVAQHEIERNNWILIKLEKETDEN